MIIQKNPNNDKGGRWGMVLKIYEPPPPHQEKAIDKKRENKRIKYQGKYT